MVAGDADSTAVPPQTVMQTRQMNLSGALVAVALTTAAVTAVTGCGSALNAGGPGQEGPARAADAVADTTAQQQAQSGVTALLDHDAVTATMTLDADPATLDAVFAADTDSPLPQGAAGKLAGATVVMAARTGGGSFRSLPGQGSLPASAAYSLTVNTRSTPDLVQVVGTATALYARADVDQLLGLLGAGQVSELLHGPNLPAPLATLVAGRWVSIDLAALKARAGASVPSVGPSQAAALARALDMIFHKDVTVTTAMPDPKLGDHFVLSGNVRALGTDLLTAVKGLLGSPPGASGLLGSATTSLPDKTVTVDEYVRKGTATAFRFDLSQLLNAAETKAAAGRPIMLTVGLSPTATVTPPSSATPLDSSALTGLLGQALGGLMQHATAS